jgi:hypothetical protein
MKTENTDTIIKLSFSNKAKYNINVVWVDVSGNEVELGIIEPNGNRST